MQKLVITTITGGLLAASSAVAGDFTVPVAPPTSAPAAAAGGALTVGYNSAYIFRGLNLGTDQVYSQLDYAVEVPAAGLTLDVGAWYSSTDLTAQNQELNLYASTSKDLGFANLTVGYVLYHFNNNVDAHEVFFGLDKELYGVDVSLTYYWDVAGGAAAENQGYTELGLGKGINLAGYELDLSATIGYLVEEGELSHATLKAAYDIPVGSATLTPYVAYSFELDDLEQYNGSSQQNEFFAGAALSVSF